MSTVASPSACSASMPPESRFSTWLGSAGAPMVTTAFTESTSGAAANTAAPPNEWPISRPGASYRAHMNAEAATRSATLVEKLVSAKSPSDAPNPVKSKRITAMPASASATEMRAAAATSDEQVKQ